MDAPALRLGGAFARPPLRKRLYLAAAAWALFALVMLIGNALLARDRAITRDVLGHDFMAFYAAGHFARTGQFDQIYDLDAVCQFQTHTALQAKLEWNDAIAPFWNPPIYAWVMAPLSALPYRAALGVWWAINALSLAGALAILWRMLPPDMDWRSKLLLPILVLLSLPAWSALAHGQNSCMSLLILAGVVWHWRQAAGLRAGLLCALLFYKPQLALVIALVLWAMLGRRALLGLLIGGAALLLLTWLAMPGIIESYLDRMPGNLEQLQEASRYYWERHVTLKAFWRLLIQGHQTGATWMSVQVLWALSWLMAASGLCAAVLRYRRFAHRDHPVGGVADAAFQRAGSTTPPTAESAISGFGTEPSSRVRDPLIAAAIVAMPLLMPFYFDYDLLLLAIPATLLAARAGRWLVRGWVALYLALLIGAGVWSKLGVQGTTLALSALAAIHVRLALRRQIVLTIEPEQPALRQAA